MKDTAGEFVSTFQTIAFEQKQGDHVSLICAISFGATGQPALCGPTGGKYNWPQKLDHELRCTIGISSSEEVQRYD